MSPPKLVSKEVVTPDPFCLPTIPTSELGRRQVVTPDPPPASQHLQLRGDRLVVEPVLVLTRVEGGAGMGSGITTCYHAALRVR